MDVIHQYILPVKRKEADCATCLFAEPILNLDGKEVLLCTERMYDPKTLKCYLPKEENSNENP